MYSASGPISGSRRAAVQVRGARETGAAMAAWRAPAACAPARLEVIASMAQPLYSIEATSTFWAKMPLSANRSKNFWKYWISLGLNSL